MSRLQSKGSKKDLCLKHGIIFLIRGIFELEVEILESDRSVTPTPNNPYTENSVEKIFRNSVAVLREGTGGIYNLKNDLSSIVDKRGYHGIFILESVEVNSKSGLILYSWPSKKFNAGIDFSMLIEFDIIKKDINYSCFSNIGMHDLGPEFEVIF